MRTFSLALLLLLCARARADGGWQAEVEARVRLRQKEAALLHRRLDISGLRLFDGRRWVRRPPAADVLLVNIWSIHCGPCMDEMPVFRRIAAELGGERGLALAFVNEDDEIATGAFLLGPRDPKDPRRTIALPPGPHYLSTTTKLRAGLQNDMQPMTLLLDRKGVVRQAIAGSVLQRRSELLAGLEALLYRTRARDRDPAGPAPYPSAPHRVDENQQGAVQYQGSWEAQWAYRASEAALLHRRLDRRGLRLWTPQAQTFADQTPELRAANLVLVWPRRCGAPCTRELERLRKLATAFPSSHVRFLAVRGGSEDAGGVRLIWYDATGRPHEDLIENLDPGLQDLGSPRTPALLLLLDDQLTVRQAFVGPLASRGVELAASIERLAGIGPRRPQVPQGASVR